MILDGLFLAGELTAYLYRTIADFIHSEKDISHAIIEHEIRIFHLDDIHWLVRCSRNRSRL